MMVFMYGTIAPLSNNNGRSRTTNCSPNNTINHHHHVSEPHITQQAYKTSGIIVALQHCTGMIIRAKQRENIQAVYYGGKMQTKFQAP